ncbi:MAG: transposase [Desulfitobacteriaceae bacterium]|nr:transposase [Desulfitobacteriaceae bacterium]
MKLAKSCVLSPSSNVALVLGHLTYAAWKLWNVANYERKTWTKESGVPYPNWFEQKKRLKEHFWYNNLPSQSAQELLHILDGSWKSFFKLKETNGVENPKPPKYKQENFNVKYLKDGFTVLSGNRVRLAIPKQLRGYLQKKFDFKDTFLYVDVPNHLQLGAEQVKTLEFKPLSAGKYELIAVVEVPDQEEEPKLSEKFMSIDFGVNNFLTCYLNDGSSHIFSGRQLLAVNRYFDKMIRYYDSLSDSQQAAKGIQYPKQSKRVDKLYEKRRRQVKHLLHAMTRAVINLAVEHGVDTIILGDLAGIRKEKDFGAKTNQKFHKWPFRKVMELIGYKAALARIAVIKISEEYTSQTCSVCKPLPSQEYAHKSNRKHRGLYVCKDCGTLVNADVNGAINIAKKYLETQHSELTLSAGRPVVVLGTPRMYRFDGCSFVA